MQTAKVLQITPPHPWQKILMYIPGDAEACNRMVAFDLHQHLLLLGVGVVNDEISWLPTIGVLWIVHLFPPLRQRKYAKYVASSAASSCVTLSRNASAAPARLFFCF